LRDLVLELSRGLRAHVLPFLGSHAGRAHVQAGVGGDVTFEIDRRAEAFLEEFLAEHAPNVAFYSEDRGLVLPGTSSRHTPADLLADRRPFPSASYDEDPEWVLVVDPIDGTRPAMAGLESCCVSVASAPWKDGTGPVMGDVDCGCVIEIKTGSEFVSVRGQGLEIRDGNGETAEPTLSANGEIARMFWTFGFRGRPAEHVMTVLAELTDASSVGGAVFDLGSATFDMTRLVTGQLDAYVDVGTRMIEEVPAVRADFERLGGGAVLNNSPYDLAAAALCLEEAGAVVTDAYGRSLASRSLLGSGHEFQMSCVAAANPVLHARVLELLERGFERLAARVGQSV
jgi:myo-inositol-1(or 4)-monophosphatase